ncbi:hypothetical protein FOL47_002542 [Perkinsus chesapeaki]|uniref:Uncharacterized protein n=1 Tax=Perkinsus chesapeaki TaxID=330153 RepID=A0A7J6MCZ6_PERCH|nr:hypothetical protein FOL47_002542 [Perkinsus chesapeaki]
MLMALLISIIWYSSTIYLAAYRFPSVVAISFEGITVDRHFRCGMVRKNSSFCIRGTTNVRIRNGLWTDIEILRGLAIWDIQVGPNTATPWTTHLTIGGGRIPSRSDDFHTLTFVSRMNVDIPLGSKVRIYDPRLDIRVFGYDSYSMEPAPRNHLPLYVNYGSLMAEPSPRRRLTQQRSLEGRLELREVDGKGGHKACTDHLSRGL